jgi:lipopolysaccharide export system permease protein
MQFLWKYVDDFVGKGFELSVIAELMFYASATFVPMALPLAVLLSSLMLFGNLGENYELAAIKSAGISLSRIFRPLVISVVILSVSAFYFSNNILPVANLKFRTLLRDVRQKKPAVQIEAGVFYSKIENYVIKIGRKGPDGVSIYDIIIYDHTADNGNTNVTIARKGKMEMSKDKHYLVFTLYDGFNYDENLQKQGKFKYDTHPLQRTSFKKEIRRIDLSAFDFKKSDGSIFRNNYEMMNVKQLMYYRDSLIFTLDSSKHKFDEYLVNDYSFLKLYEKRKEKSDSIAAQEKKPVKKDTILPVTPEKDAEIPSIALLKRKKQTKPSVNMEGIAAQAFDTLKPFNDTLIRNFKGGLALRIINSALVQARNISYHSDFVAKTVEGKEKLIAKHEIELNRKFTLSLACLLFFFIGAPLGAIIRKGGLGTPLVMSIILFVVYYIFAIIGEKSAKELVMSPILGMWLSSLIYFPLGIFLTKKATADAPLLAREFYIKFYDRITKYLPSLKWLKS